MFTNEHQVVCFKSLTNVINFTFIKCSNDNQKHEFIVAFSIFYHSKKSFSYEIYAGTSKAAHKVFQQRGASSIREFSLLHNSQFFARKLWLKIGCIFN